ncbi:hypothetical protein GCM10022198_23310 [Klugiella xanthotipulae]|uniref:Alternate signal-mediated exported protein n=1 Tax=Klugiella xanthotipulae TaxID=244735 RepID=A0A543I5R4_9MICO|nr:alternate-type signal peptide domain-containing protein [Klugiella xanthotipulae]TQM65943.1 alternate signal-mediated exported protein [Klugiella xanthotipulae]
MNKLSKGIIVSGLGVALLLGTGGSLALWNVTSESQAGEISTGDLNLTVPTTGQKWEANVGGSWVDIDISTYRIVPGDLVRLTQPLTVTLTGNNMKAKLTVDTANAITATAQGSVPGNFLTVTSAFPTAPAGETAPTQVGTTNVWQFNGPLVGGTATYTQQITFAFSSATTGRTGALATIDLSKTNFVLEQVYTNPPA